MRCFFCLLPLLAGCDFTHGFENRLMADGGVWNITAYSYERTDGLSGEVLASYEAQEVGRITFWLDGDVDDWFDYWALLELPDEPKYEGQSLFIPNVELLNWDGEDLGGAFTLADHGDFGEPEEVEVVENHGDTMVWESSEEMMWPGDSASNISRRDEVQHVE